MKIISQGLPLRNVKTEEKYTVTEEYTAQLLYVLIKTTKCHHYRELSVVAREVSDLCGLWNTLNH